MNFVSKTSAQVLLAAVILFAIIRGLIFAPYLLNETIGTKIIVFGIGVLNIALLLTYHKIVTSGYKLIQRPEPAIQCPECNLFVPIDMKNNKNTLIPHCCYQKPKTF